MEINQEDRVISAGSSTTNAFALMLKILNSYSDIKCSSLTTIHSYTSDQPLLDIAKSDLKRSRSAAKNIIPNAYMDWTSEETIIISNKHRGYVVPDGLNELQFIRGSSISVNLKAPPLNLITYINTKISKLEHLITQ